MNRECSPRASEPPAASASCFCRCTNLGVRQSGCCGLVPDVATVPELEMASRDDKTHPLETSPGGVSVIRSCTMEDSCPCRYIRDREVRAVRVYDGTFISAQFCSCQNRTRGSYKGQGSTAPCPGQSEGEATRSAQHQDPMKEVLLRAEVANVYTYIRSVNQQPCLRLWAIERSVQIVGRWAESIRADRPKLPNESSGKRRKTHCCVYLRRNLRLT